MAEQIISPGVFQRENDISFIQPAPVEVGAAIIGPTVKGPVEDPTIVRSYNEYVRVFGDILEFSGSNYEYFTSMAAKSYFEQGGNSILVSRVVSGSFTKADSTHISASAYNSVQPFTLGTLGKGAVYNNATASAPETPELNSDGSLVSGSSDNLRWEINNVNTSSGTFSLSVRRGDDRDKAKVILETFNDLSLDPNSPNWIASVIGTQTRSISADGTTIISTGDHPNRSNYIYVASTPASGSTLNYLKADGVSIGSSSIDNTPYDKILPIETSGSFYNATGHTAPSASMRFCEHAANVSNYNQGIHNDNYTATITLLENTDEFKYNILSAPGISHAGHTSVFNSLVSLVESRGDAIFVGDLHGHGQTVSTIEGQAKNVNSSYAATYWPWVQVLSATGKSCWVPASVVIPGTYAFTDGANAPWFAPAGLVRGGLVGVIQAERRLTRTQRDTLYRGKVNPIATFPGTGIAVFGQKTLQTKASALDRVNVRRLLIALKEFIGNQANNLVFEQNTVATRNSFLAAVNPYLDSVVQRQGLYAFRVVMDDTNNTADVVDRNQLVGQIFIQPTKTAEFIVLDFVVEPTGATFGN